MLRREGWSLGKDQAYRLYTEEHLQLRSKRPRRRKMRVMRRERCSEAGESGLVDGLRDRVECEKERSNGSKSFFAGFARICRCVARRSIFD
jgi:hypothetical protein